LAPPNDTTNRVVTTEDTPITVQWRVTDVDTQLGTSSNIVVQSSNTSLVPNASANIVITGNNNVLAGTPFTVSVTVNPAGNQNGTTILSLIANDGNSTTTNQVQLDVTPVNDLPSIAFPGNEANNNPPTVSVAVGNTITVPVTIGDVETDPQSITLTATSNDQSKIPNGNIVLGGRGANRTLTITPLGSVGGTVTIAVTANDNTGGVTTRNLTVTVTPPPGQVFTSTGAISIPGTGTAGPASPYQSVLNVSGMVGKISKISVSIDGLTHTAPDDVDILLVSPTGAKVMLMSDAGGRNAISNVQLLFDQTGAPLPDEGQITSGTYQPTDFEPGTDTFPSPAPAGPYPASFTSLIGTSPNGAWSLFVVDDASGDVGQIVTGWSLRIESAPDITINTGLPVIIPEDGTASIQFTINDQVTPPQNLSVSFTSDNAALIQSVVTNSGTTGSGNSATFTAIVQPVTNGFGTNNLTIVVRRSDGAQASAVVPMSVTAVDDAPIVSRLSDRTTPADTALTIPIAITDVDTLLTSVLITASSGNQAVISTTNILIAGFTNSIKGVKANGSSTAAFPPGNLDTWTNFITIIPNTAAFSVTPVQITLTVQDLDANGVANGPSTTVNFNVTVTPVNHAPVITGLTNFVAIEAGKTTPNLTFNISDPDNDTPLTITASSSDQALVRDVISRLMFRRAGWSAHGSRRDATWRDWRRNDYLARR